MEVTKIWKVYRKYTKIMEIQSRVFFPAAKGQKNMGKIPEVRKNTENTKRIWKIQMTENTGKKYGPHEPAPAIAWGMTMA